MQVCIRLYFLMWVRDSRPPHLPVIVRFLHFFLSKRQCCSPDCALALVTHHFVCATVHVSIVRLRCIDLSLSPLPISLEGRRKVFSCGVTSAALPKQALQE